MNIGKRFRVAYNVLTNKQLSNSLGSVVRNFTGSSEFKPNAQLKGITYKAIDKIGMAVSSYVPMPKRANGDAYENHPIISLANQPNPNMSSTQFHRLWGILGEIYGETFWYLVRGDRTQKVKEVYLLPPAQMELVLDDGGEVVGYILHKNDGTKVPFDLTEVYHYKTPNPFNPLRGLSALERASDYVNTEIVTTQFTLNYMRNNASPSGIVTVPNMAKETFKQFTEQWREGYEGPANAGKTAFIRGEGVKFEAVGATLHDVDQKVTREMAKDDVLMMFDVPKGLLGISGDKGMGRTEIEALEYVFAKYKTQPLLDALDEIWFSIAKLGGLNRDNVVKLDHESPIPSDKTYELKRKQTGVNVWLTVNEVREQEGLPPLPDGDALMTTNPAKQVEQKSITKKVTFKKPETPHEKTKRLDDEQEQFRSDLVETSELYAKQLKTVISKFATEQEQTVIGKINATTKLYEEWLPEVKAESEALALLMAAVIIELTIAQTKDTTNFISGEPFEVTPQMKEKVNLQMKEIAGVYNTETIKALETTITQGQANGESLVKIKKRVEAVYSDSKGYRAERIARTESLRAANLAAEISYKQSGYKTVKWVTNPGACQFCVTMEARVREIGGKYINIGDVVTSDAGDQMRIEYRDIDVPPLHPNCKCSLVGEN